MECDLLLENIRNRLAKKCAEFFDLGIFCTFLWAANSFVLDEIMVIKSNTKHNSIKSHSNRIEDEQNGIKTKTDRVSAFDDPCPVIIEAFVFVEFPFAVAFVSSAADCRQITYSINSNLILSLRWFARHKSKARKKKRNPFRCAVPPAPSSSLSSPFDPH